MFDLAMPWWEFPLRAAAVYLVLMLLVRLSGKRTVGQFTPFDLLVVMLLSEAVSNSLSGEDNSLAGGLILATTLVALNLTVAFISSRSKRMERLIEGTAVLIGRDGRFFDEILKSHRISSGEIEQALREADCVAGDMVCAFLETDGEISIMKKKE